MDTDQKLILRDLLLEQLIDSRSTYSLAVTQSALEPFKDSLRRLRTDYSVYLVVAGVEGGGLKGRPLQLLVSPLDPALAAALLIRVSGVLSPCESGQAGLDFKPSSVEICPPLRRVHRDEFQHETHSSLNVIGHVHQVLSVLRHEHTDRVVLSA